MLVKDIRPGIGLSSFPGYSGGSDGSSFTLMNLGGTLFFSADDGINGFEIWKSDGSSAGTAIVKNINVGAGNGSFPSLFTNVDGSLFFNASDGVNGYELWKSDGTDGGTTLVKDINVGAGDSCPVALTNVNGTLFFSAEGSGSNSELWKSDGTSAGTVLVKDINPGASGSFPGFSGNSDASSFSLTNANGKLFFSANTPTGGFELWKSDGTTAGTVQLPDIAASTASSSPSEMRFLAGRLLFAATSSAFGRELWSVITNESPIVSEASFTLSENTAIGSNVGLAMASDPDPNSAFVWAITAGNNGGAFSINSDGQIRVADNSLLDFETAANFQLVIQATDNDKFPQSGSRTITLNLLNVNEAPTGIFFFGNSVLENAAGAVVGDVLAIDPDVGDAAVLSVDDARFEVVVGKLKLKSDQKLNFETTPTFPIVLTATDLGGLTRTQSLMISVINVNEAPLANSQSQTGFEDQLVIVALAASDEDGDILFYTIPNLPLYGTLSGSGSNLIYEPASDFNGNDSFTFKASDSGLDSELATVSIGIAALNDRPRFTLGTIPVASDEDGSKSIAGATTDLSAGPPDEASQALTFHVAVPAEHQALFRVQPAISTITGALTFTPQANAKGVATIAVTLSDDGGGDDTSAPQTFTITVNKPHPWHNSATTSFGNLNVNGKDGITLIDAVMVINYLNSAPPAGTGSVPTSAFTAPSGLPTVGYIDTAIEGQNANLISILDALMVINYLNTPQGEGEGPALAQPASDSAERLASGGPDALENLYFLLALDATEQSHKRKR